MDDLEIRIPKEISEYHEKFYGLTLRQIICCIVIVAINVPLYMFLSDAVGSDLASYAVILVAAPIGFVGFVKIHNLDAEKIIPFWWRNYVSFAKPLVYKTEKEIEAEKNAKKHRNKKKAKQATKEETIAKEEELIESDNSTSALSKKEIRKQEKAQEKAAKIAEKEKKKKDKIEAQRHLKEEKEHRKKLKEKRKAQRELEEAKRKYGLIDTPVSKSSSSALNEEDLAVLKQLAQALGKEKSYVQKEESEKEEHGESNEGN